MALTFWHVCIACGKLHQHPGPRCPDHAREFERERNKRRAASKLKRKATNRNDPAVRQAMAIAVATAGRCSSCGALPGQPPA